METRNVEWRLFWHHPLCQKPRTSKTGMLCASLTPPKAVETKQVRDFIAGAIGGTCGTILNTPFDVVKTRIQSSSFNHQWTLSAMKHIISEEG